MSGSARIRITKVAEPGKVAAQLERPVRNLSANIAVRMRRLVPKRSWRLNDTIAVLPVERDGGKVRGGVKFGNEVVRGKLVDYHLHVEYGTSRAPAQPFARPALYQSRARDLVTEVVDK